MLNWVDFVAGWVGGVAGLIIAYPLDTIKTCQQVTGNSFVKTVYNTYKQQGVLGYYKGFFVPFLVVGPSNAVFFLFYAKSLRWLQKSTPAAEIQRADLTNPNWIWNVGIAGMIGGFAQVVVTCPMEVIKTILQTNRLKKDLVPELNTGRGIIKAMYRHSRLSWLFRGFTAMCIRDVPSSAIYTLVYEGLLPHNQEISLKDLIIAGGIAGSASWSPIVPFDVIKTRMQNDSFLNPQYKGSLDCVLQLYKKEGVTVFTRGFLLTILRGFPVNAAIFVGYECCLLMFKKLNIAE
ncbi:hypothetical protein FQA39_LY13873 [Lamprigera yunnana]|nr:hypothetical protein FQA39_LY13873 [Lamprigera yunnana]